MAKLIQTRLIPLLLIPILALSALSLAPVPGVSAAAAIHLAPPTAAPGDGVTVTGSGFAPAADVVVSSDYRTAGTTKRAETTTRARGDGSFTATFTIPSDAYPGSYTVRARDFSNHDATTALTVLPVVIFTAGGKTPPAVNVAAEHFFFASGSGFKPGEAVQITGTFPLFNGNSVNVHGTVTANAHGAFHDVSLRIPRGAKTGTSTLTATGSSSGKKATASINVVYYPNLKLTSTATRPGGTITVEGTGFVPNSKVHVSLPVQRASTTVTLSSDATTDDHGYFKTTLNLPTGTQTGTYKLTAADGTGQISATTDVSVTLKPVVSLSTSAVSPGQSIKVTGGGFSANVTVQITATFRLYQGGNKSVSAQAQTDGNGAFSATIGVPGHAASGTVTVQAQGPKARAQATLSVKRIGATISLQPGTIVPGTAVTVKGSGYPANDKVDITVNVRMTDGSSAPLTTSVRTNGQGQFSVRLQIPGNVATGSYTLVARSEASGRAPSALLNLAVSARITLRPAVAQPGGTMYLTGNGFSANVPVTVTATFPLYGGGSKNVSTTARTNGNGAVTAAITVPSNAASGPVAVSAKGPNTKVNASFNVGQVSASIVASPISAIPGSVVKVNGSGYLSGATIDVTIALKTVTGADKTLTKTVTTNGSGQFTAQLQIPGNIAGGTYTIVGRSRASGRAPKATLTIAKLTASIVSVPTSAAPGTQVTVHGFGFASGATITLTLAGQKAGTATANAAGQFTAQVTVPASSASGNYTLSATSNYGRKATIGLAVNRQVATHFYFASLYTGTNYHEYIALLNPTATQSQVTITYQLTNGTTRSKTAIVKPQSRYTEDVNADLGPKVSSAAVVAADVPIAAERLVYHGSDGSIVPGAPAPATTWYFANGNTSGKYREYIAIQNPNTTQIQVAIRLLPTHRRAFTLNRTMAPTSRLTIKVKSFVRDAVGVIVTANAPVVANRTMFIRHGMNSKIGVNTPHRSWYFAGGTRNGAARYYIGAINPSNSFTRVTLRMYNPFGQQVGSQQSWLKPHGREGYAIHRLAHRTDVAVVLTASNPVVAEQNTYVGKMHDASTDTFGAPAPAKVWNFAAVNTANASDALDLFNPSLVPVPIVVRFMTVSGSTTERTYVVSPFSHQRVDVSSVEPNTQLGIVAASNQPFVALNRLFFNNRLGSATSTGIHS